MIGHLTRLRENDDLPLWRGPTVKKKPSFFNTRALITREIMRSRDRMRNAILGNDLKDGAYFCWCAHVLRIMQAMV